MDGINYRDTIVRLLDQYTGRPYINGDITNEFVVDDEHQQYIAMMNGWEDKRRVHGTLIHLAIRSGKIWVERDGTDAGIVNELVEAGISKDQIVLGFKSLSIRPYTDFAVT